MAHRDNHPDAEQSRRARRPGWGRAAAYGIRKALTALGIVLATLSMYLMLVLANPSAAQEEDSLQSGGPPPASMATQEQPLPAGAAAFTPDRLSEALRIFGYPVLALPAETGYVLRSIEMADLRAATSQGKVRAIYLTYQYGGTDAYLTLSSFTPAAYAQALTGTGLSLSLTQDFTIAGMRAVYMIGADMLHLHMQSADCLYQIEGLMHISDFRRAASQATLYVTAPLQTP